MDYEAVIGMEVHVELDTKSKMFCPCSTNFHAEPNTNVCPICLGMPGVLPVINRKAVDMAVAVGLALNCQVSDWSKMDRKNYFYPDLAKNYQISQYDLPLCHDGWLEVKVGEETRRIGIRRTHLEEDTARNTHTIGGGESGVDFNRSGVPLIEIVSEPDIRSAEEAVGYLRKLRAILTYIGVSDCRMNEGSLRCDVNLSIHKPGEPFGVRTEMKNLNSFQSVERAIQAEFDRQVAAVEAGEEIVQETRRYDQKTGKTSTMRRKENSADYRYFPDPDLPEVRLTDDDMTAIVAAIPTLPDARRHTFVQGDICDRALVDDLLRRYAIDTIAHFAAETHVDRSILGPGQFVQTNVIGTFTLLEAARQADRKSVV